MNEIERRDRIKFCKSDFENLVKILQRQRLWSSDIAREVVSIMNDYFNINPFRNVPAAVMQEIFLWLPVDKFSPISSVCWEWHDVATSNEVWMRFYAQKYLSNNPGRLPTMRDDVYNEFRSRLLDPQIGDKVEVAWKGKFRLETQDVYQGLAWWVAEIVDKHQSQGRYKIRYPGWESRWDEWVPRSRLRWAVDRNTVVSIHVGDTVELWCCGANVPGAWLETKVKKIRNDRGYCLGKVICSGNLWVDRERLRLVKCGEDDVKRKSGKDFAIVNLSSMLMSMNMSFGSTNSMDENSVNNDTRASCSVM